MRPKKTNKKETQSTRVLKFVRFSFMSLLTYKQKSMLFRKSMLKLILRAISLNAVLSK